MHSTSYEAFLTALCTAMQVNSQLQTSNPDVYAVGDIAAFPLTLYGGKVTRQEHVVNARLVRLPLTVFRTIDGCNRQCLPVSQRPQQRCVWDASQPSGLSQ